VSIFDDQQKRVEQSGELTATHWKPATDLAPGKVYEWQVRATAGDTTELAPGAGGAAARFLVLDAAAATRLRQLADRHSGDHLLLGVLYAQAGALDLAESELASAGERGARLLAYLRGIRR
jgi:hypothetical protein